MVQNVNSAKNAQTENLYTPNCIRTFTGRYVNLKDPQQESIMPFDIAIGLARQCRFGGHTKKFYSVAQHSDWCRQTCELQYPDDASLAFKVLLHDAHEYILSDIPTPLKALMPEYDNIAEKLQETIHRRFGVIVTPREQAIIKDIDKRALEWEWQTKVLQWGGPEYTVQDAADIFINHFVRLCRVPFVLQ